MKKLSIMLATLLLAFSLVSCAEAATEEQVFDAANLEEYVNSIVTNVELSNADYKAMVEQSCQTMEITDDMKEYHLGSADYEYTRAVIHEPMMTSQAFAIAMIATETPEQAQTMAEELLTTVNPVKWVCVGVEEENIKTAVKGNLVFLIMGDEPDAFTTAFNENVTIEE